MINIVKNILAEYNPIIIVELGTDFLSNNKINDITSVLKEIKYLNDVRFKMLYSAKNAMKNNLLTSMLNEGDIVCSESELNLGELNLIKKEGEIYLYVKGNLFVDTDLHLYPLDVLVMSSSRPKLIPYCVESFKRGLFTRRKLNWILHEDYVFPKQSEQVVSWAKDHFDEIYQHNPAIGLGKSMDKALYKIKSKYLIYLQDDWYLERPVDLDQIIWTMDNHEKINGVMLFKFNIGYNNGFFCKEYDFDGLKLCIYHKFGFLPSIWRTSKIVEKWNLARKNDISVKPEAKLIKAFATREQEMDLNYNYENVGNYLYGTQGSPRMVKHLGENWRMAEWRRVNGRPGGNTNHIEVQERYRAPWIGKIETPVYEGEEL